MFFNLCSLKVRGNITQWLPVLEDIQTNMTTKKMTEILKVKVVKVVTVTFSAVFRDGRVKECVWLQETCILNVATLTNGTGQYILLSGYCRKFLILSFHGNSLLMLTPTHFNLEDGCRKLVQNV